MTRALTRPGLLLALALLTAVAVLVPRPAFGMACRSYGCGCCGHPPNPPWHYPGCRYYGRGLSSGGSSGGSSGRHGGGAATGNAFGAMVDGFSKGIQEAQEAQARAARLAAERRRRAEIARRQRLERLRLERIRRARRRRIDWDRRGVEMGERLEGVFDPVIGGSSTAFFGVEGTPEPDIYVDSSVVDLRPEPSGQQALEGQLRMNPAFLQAQARRAAATDAFATENYGSVMPWAGQTPKQPRRFTFYLPPGPGPYSPGRLESAMHGLVADVARALDPDELMAAAIYNDPDALARYARLPQELMHRFGGHLLGERTMSLGEILEARKDVGGTALGVGKTFLTTGLELGGWTRVAGYAQIGLAADSVRGTHGTVGETMGKLDRVLTGGR